MSLKALLGILFVATLMWVVASVSLHNQATLGVTLRFPGGRDVPVYLVILGAFSTGFLLAFLNGLFRTSVTAIERWRLTKVQRDQARTEEIFAAAKTALLGGDRGQAEDMYRSVLGRDPHHVGALLDLGTLVRERGEPREAAELHREASRSRPGALAPLLELAGDALAAGEVRKAVDALERAVAAHPRESLTARKRLRELHVGQGNWQEALAAHTAIDAARKAAKEAEPPGERLLAVGLRYESARAQLKAGRTREAERELKAILREEPGFVPAALALGEAQNAGESRGEGIRTWIRGFEASANPVFLTRIEEHFLGREDPQAAIETLKAIVGAASDRTLPSFFLGKLYMRLEMIDEADTAFASLSSAASDSPTVRYFQARILFRRGRYRDAADTYRKVIRDSGTLKLTYRCAACRKSEPAWAARCPGCGQWGRLDADLRDEMPARSAAEERVVWGAGA